MTESQQLLAEYVETGSETAFRELVTRYIALIYSTALRLVEGDTASAEDVTQTVFLHLSRNARKLARESVLGGWLHRDTCYVAAKTLRRERRRQAREREAVLMNSLEDHSQANLDKVAPLLDEAINQLGTEDRAAVLLRFFEQRDFRAVGAALGSTEDAARMRVTRALEKLQVLLKHRGVTLSAAALGTALAGQAVTAAPAGLAASVTGSVLASSAASGGIAATVLKIMAMTKLKAGIVSAVVVAGVATSSVVQYQARARLRAQDGSLQQQSEQLAQLAADNQRLSNVVAQEDSSRGQLSQLPKLRAEAESLRRQTSGLAVLRAENRRLQQRPDTRPKTPLAEQEENVAKLNLGFHWLAALRNYAEKHGGQFPTTLDQAASFLPDKAKAESSRGAVEFEILYHGTQDAMTNFADGIVLREKQPRQTSDGKWVRIYGFADGHTQARASDDGNFDAYEKQHLVGPPAP
jgi:RNA polymerase sigma factor (sigma-70 family)